jgi:hypothetical protein
MAHQNSLLDLKHQVARMAFNGPRSLIEKRPAKFQEP